MTLSVIYTEALVIYSITKQAPPENT